MRSGSVVHEAFREVFQVSSQGHTPGPWTVLLRADSRELVILDENRGCIAEVFAVRDTRDFKTVFANASLIAAAPDMVSALIEVERYMKVTFDVVAGSRMFQPQAGKISDYLSLVRGSISKATFSISHGTR